jgi:cation diffusion facilitator CzcD-associated flavoprotein CzcO
MGNPPHRVVILGGGFGGLYAAKQLGVLVIFQWGWNYLTRKRGARLITGDEIFPTPDSGTDSKELIND